LDRVTEELPFPTRSIQTDRGMEFFAESVQRRLMAAFIKFRPIPPRSPHLNGKVERSQLTDLVEFWSRHSLKEEAIQQRIEEWQFVYNYRRSHGGLGGERTYCRKSPTTNLRNESGIAIGRKTKPWQRYTNRAHVRSCFTQPTYRTCRP
jgi:transposase InsO family protein